MSNEEKALPWNALIIEPYYMTDAYHPAVWNQFTERWVFIAAHHDDRAVCEEYIKLKVDAWRAPCGYRHHYTCDCKGEGGDR